MRWKSIVLGVVLLAGIVAGLGFFWPFGSRNDALRLPGLVEIQEVRLGSKVGGRVAEVGVAEGDQVEAGQILVRLEAPELEAQRDQQAARVREAESSLEKARNGPRQEEKDVARALSEAANARLKRLKAGNRDEEIQQAKSEYATAEADAQLAREEFSRAQRLANVLSKSEFDQHRATLDRSQGRAAAAKARRDLLVAGTRAEDIEEAEAESRRADANHRLLLAGTRSEELAEVEAKVAEARGKLREIEANLREATVLAPEPAVVEVLAVRKGDIVAANQPMLRVLRTADLWVKVYVPETEMSKVRLGDTVQITVDGYGNQRFQGKVLQINSESEFTPRNVQSVDERRHQVFGVRIRLDAGQGVFKSGMAAQVVLPLH